LVKEELPRNFQLVPSKLHNFQKFRETSDHYNGTLSGEDLVRQFHQVVMRCETIPLKEHFKAICKLNCRLTDGTKCTSGYNTVYEVVVRKVIHARFADAFRRFKEKAVTMKNKIPLRNHLKVSVATKQMSRKPKQRKEASGSSTKKGEQTDFPSTKASTNKRRQIAYPKPTEAESRLARKKRRQKLDNKRLKKRLFAGSDEFQNHDKTVLLK